MAPYPVFEASVDIIMSAACLGVGTGTTVLGHLSVQLFVPLVPCQDVVIKSP